MADTVPDPGWDNLATLGYLERAVELSDSFALLFACCEQPALRDELIAILDNNLAQEGLSTRRLDVAPPGAGLLAGLKAVCSASGARPAPACVHVCGLDEALSSGAPPSPLLGQLNLARENFRELPCALVLWLSNEALVRLARGAPDFWAWRSGSFDFLPRPGYAQEPAVQPAGLHAWTRAEDRIRVLENLLADYRTLGDGRMEQRARADLLVELAALYQATSQPRTARQRLAEALPLLRGLTDGALESRAREVQRQLTFTEG